MNESILKTIEILKAFNSRCLKYLKDVQEITFIRADKDAVYITVNNDYTLKVWFDEKNLMQIETEYGESVYDFSDYFESEFDKNYVRFNSTYSCVDYFIERIAATKRQYNVRSLGQPVIVYVYGMGCVITIVEYDGDTGVIKLDDEEVSGKEFEAWLQLQSKYTG